MSIFTIGDFNEAVVGSRLMLILCNCWVLGIIIIGIIRILQSVIFVFGNFNTVGIIVFSIRTRSFLFPSNSIPRYITFVMTESNRAFFIRCSLIANGSTISYSHNRLIASRQRVSCLIACTTAVNTYRSISSYVVACMYVLITIAIITILITTTAKCQTIESRSIVGCPTNYSCIITALALPACYGWTQIYSSILTATYYSRTSCHRFIVFATTYNSKTTTGNIP